MQRITVKKKTA